MRLNYPKISQEGFGKIVELLDYITRSEIEEGLIHIIYLRVSQINGCSYCIDAHWKDAIKSGEDPRKLNLICKWQDTSLFSDRERAALAWAESVTACNNEAGSQDYFDEIKSHFSEKEISDLTIAITQMNALNRLAIAFHVTPK